MFVSLEFGGSFGHAGVLLTGLGDKSCFLHLSGTSYPRKKYTMHGEDSPSQLTRDLTGRVLIPSIEDGNSFGVSEMQALQYWRYYKTKTYNHPTWGDIWKDKNRGRGDALNAKYTNENHNCSLFANRLLIAAALNRGIDTNSGFLISLAHVYTFSIKTPGWFTARSRKVRDQILTHLIGLDEEPIYGYQLENLHKVQNKVRYSPADNLRDGAPEQIPENLKAVYAGNQQDVASNPYNTQGAKPPKQTHNWQANQATMTARPSQKQPASLLSQLDQIFGEVSGL